MTFIEPEWEEPRYTTGSNSTPGTSAAAAAAASLSRSSSTSTSSVASLVFVRTIRHAPGQMASTFVAYPQLVWKK